MGARGRPWRPASRRSRSPRASRPRRVARVAYLTAYLSALRDGATLERVADLGPHADREPVHAQLRAIADQAQAIEHLASLDFLPLVAFHRHGQIVAYGCVELPLAGGEGDAFEPAPLDLAPQQFDRIGGGADTGVACDLEVHGRKP